MMNSYDADRAPDPSEWLAADESERHVLILDFHRNARIPLPKVTRAAHAAIHVAVEDQLALEDQEIVRATLQRLMQEGLSRHDAVHAIGSVLIEHIHGVLRAAIEPTDLSEYYAALRQLTVDSWRDG